MRRGWWTLDKSRVKVCRGFTRAQQGPNASKLVIPGEGGGCFSPTNFFFLPLASGLPWLSESRHSSRLQALLWFWCHPTWKLCCMYWKYMLLLVYIRSENKTQEYILYIIFSTKYSISNSTSTNHMIIIGSIRPRHFFMLKNVILLLLISLIVIGNFEVF